MTTDVKKPVWKKWWFWVGALIVVGAILPPNEKRNSGSSHSDVIAKRPADDVIAQRPADEAKFISIVSDAQTKARVAANDMQKGGIKAEREKALCANMEKLQVSNWTGWVRSIDANSDGKGVLAVEIAKDITVTTWNNDLSDIMHKTLLEPGSAVFSAASQMKKRQAVTFSGSFSRGSEDEVECVYESSMSLDGKLLDPEFIMRFTHIEVFVPKAASPAKTS